MPETVNLDYIINITRFQDLSEGRGGMRSRLPVCQSLDFDVSEFERPINEGLRIVAGIFTLYCRFQ